jgi:hypothetical protein
MTQIARAYFQGGGENMAPADAKTQRSKAAQPFPHLTENLHLFTLGMQ